MQIDQSTTEHVHQEIILCTEILAAIHDKDFIKVFYSCFIRFIIFSMSKRSLTDIGNERLGLWATFTEIRKRGTPLAPGQLFTMENCLCYAGVPTLMSFSSQLEVPYLQLRLSSEQDNLLLPTLSYAVRSSISW